MATWHQEKAGPVKIPGGFVMVSDIPYGMMSMMTFGDNEEQALKVLGNYRKNVPNQSHRLFHNGRRFA
mgnify:CR=1 FL=1